MSDPAEMVCGIEAALSCNPDIPVVATYAFQKTANAGRRNNWMAALSVLRRQIRWLPPPNTRCGSSWMNDHFPDCSRNCPGVMPLTSRKTRVK
jgi:hypothetical protein